MIANYIIIIYKRNITIIKRLHCYKCTRLYIIIKHTQIHCILPINYNNTPQTSGESV